MQAASQPNPAAEHARTETRSGRRSPPLWFAPMPPCREHVLTSDSAFAHFLDFSPSGAPVSLSPSLVRSFVCFGFSPARESCSGAQRRAFEGALLPFRRCSTGPSCPSASGSVLLSPLPPAGRTPSRRVRRAAFMAGAERVRSALPLLHALTFMSPTAFNGVACPARPPNTAMGHGYSQGQG